MKTKSIFTTYFSWAAVVLVALLSTMTAGAKTRTVTSESTLVVLEDGDVLTGTGGIYTRVYISNGATVVFNGVDLTASAKNDGPSSDWPCVYCAGDNVIILEGTNKVKGICDGDPGIYIRYDGSLTINGIGSLIAQGGENAAGIGAGARTYSAFIIVHGGGATNKVKGIGEGPDIQNRHDGFLTIDGNDTIIAQSAKYAADRDSGDSTSDFTCNLIIEGGNITAQGGMYGAGIGSNAFSGFGNIFIKGGTITAQGGLNGAGIGSGIGSSCGNIFIEGGSITAQGGEMAAGIGSGYNLCECGTITISGGNVTAIGGLYAAGVGSGGCEISLESSSCGDITISGGTVTAYGNEHGQGAGIGGGWLGSCGNITISDGTVTATSRSAASIGSGAKGSCQNIIISGGNITAQSSSFGVGIGGSIYGSCGDITITGGTITARGTDYGAGIGGGADGSCGNINIGSGITRIIATARGDVPNPIGKGAAYHFNNASCGTVTISPKLVDVTLDGTRTLYFEGPVVPFLNSNTVLYTLTSKRGGMVMNANGTGLAAEQSRTNVPEEDKYFDIITHNGKQYLYSPKSKKYLRNDGTFVPELGSPIIIDGNFADGDYKYMLFSKNGNGDVFVFNNDGSDIVINNHNTPDEGNRWRIEPVDNTELTLQGGSSNADAIAEYDGQFVNVQLSDRTLYNDGSWNTLCLPFDVDDLSGTPLDGCFVMELDTESAIDGHVTGFAPMSNTCYLNFKPVTSIKAGQPYIVKRKSYLAISSEDDWNAFAANVANGVTYEGQVVQLTADIFISTMVGTSTNRFKGTFDGNGHELAMKLKTSGQYSAPFRYVDGATFRNLRTGGVLFGTEKYRSGLIGEVRNKVTISNCWSTVFITSSIEGDGTHGGFIGEVKAGGDVVIDNCFFDGGFIGSNTNCWGGFVGWSQGVTTIKNSAFIPQDINFLDSSSSKTFGRNKVTTENCYYSEVLGEAQGTAVGSMTNEQLAAALGSGWQVNDGELEPIMKSNIIGSEADWNTFATNVANGVTYEGQTVQLVADINISTMAGTSDHRFKGIFEGNGHSLTMSLDTNGEYSAPFRYIDGATIQNLHTYGYISSNYKFCAGLVGETINDVTISNCWSSVTIYSGVKNDGTHGGFIGVVQKGNVVINNCLFDGRFSGYDTNQCGGFVGWTNGTTTIKNSVFMPKELYIGEAGSATFGRSNNNNVTTENCYYSRSFGTVQGTNARGMTAEELAEVVGSDWQVVDGKAVPKTACTSPMFYGMTIKNVAPATVTSRDGKVSFTGSYNPVTASTPDLLYLGANNELRYPNAAMTIESYRACFLLPGGTGDSTLGDVNGDGQISVADVMAVVSYVIGTVNSGFIVENADINSDGQISIADVMAVVDMVLHGYEAKFSLVVNGADGITYGDGGTGPARAKKN